MSDIDGAPDEATAVSVHRPIPAGWIGATEAPRVAAKPVRRGVPLEFAHLPLGAVPRRTADWDDPDRTKYPTRGDILSAHTEVTPVKFHPAELPDPESAFAAQMYPQAIPAQQIDPRHQTHSLSESVPVDSPVRHLNRRK